MLQINNVPENNYINESPKNEISFFWYFKKIMEEFCDKTPLHGYKFIILKKASLSEKLFWSIISISAIFITIYIVYLAFANGYNKNPTITVCDSTIYLTSAFNFPSITVCNINKMSKLKVNKIAQQISDELQKKMPSNETQIYEIMDDLRYIYNLVYAEYKEEDSVIYSRLDRYMNLIEKNPIELVNYFAPSCQELITYCRWKKKETRCNSMFQQSITPEGVCCTANNFALKNFTFTGYRAERYKYKPLVSAICGATMGLKLTLNLNPEDYFLSEFQSVGAKILFDDPKDFIEWGSQSVVVSANRLTNIDVIPTGVDYDPSLVTVDPEVRGCVTKKEIQLDIFSTYTKTNCLNDCRMELIITNCSCVPLYYINKDVVLDDTRPCDLSDIPCLSRMKGIYMNSVPGFNESTINTTNHNWGEETSICKCPPNCHFDNYSLRKSEIHNSNTTIHISYRFIYGTLYLTKMNLNWSAVFGVVGGLVTLTLGFSPIAGLTVIYYFVIKLCFYRKQPNYIQDEEIEIKKIRNENIPTSNHLQKTKENPRIQQITLPNSYHAYDKQYSLPYLD